MPQAKAVLENVASPEPIEATFDPGSLWRRLDDHQLELWLGDYIWFSDFAEPEYRAECARTCDELIVECSLRDRHDMIRRAWARLARRTRGKA
jgi:hypothetical protein